ncbi:MAG: cytochrome c oxidase accessory protein CcoG [Gammaproteobacteria bacterium]|nr:cytochrome c oxidase accessory protein CcoG [Sideroxydans sp.]MBU3902889.1 cytochrome c oxidase accessory protein CcoG [Gammaproteobacteria bacterium]MBU4045691.1 cytochrome c oxidase accessory protein CcoG [Gammaproteobacteria bacterium]MBU4150627.1 cytochrome c oxidase accessory protein CcoG [Gammaproteobacteria bacterium]
MNDLSEQKQMGEVTTLYHDLKTWELNPGDQTTHAKRMPGFFRTLKNYTQWGLWLPFFLLPYLRWNGQQAILFDIQNRQFRCYNITVLPQDIWMLSLVLLIAAMTLFAVTSVASRVWCGYFCFQTAWTDWFTWLEEKIEGNPAARRKLDDAPWSLDKLKKKVVKHALWLLIALLTGISYSIWFVDAYAYWDDLLHFNLPTVGWVVLVLFIAGTYILTGLMREQTCFWLCPYARLQGVMTDAQTILPAYDTTRGEPRGKLRRNGEVVAPQGDCIDCFQCVQVCPTGVDIREGQQFGCITCGLCIDACDAVMDKIDKPRGLIRYASLDELSGKPVKPLYKHPRTLVYLAIILLAIGGIVYGLTHLGAMTLKVLPERQPLFVQMSDGSIQNKYAFKVLNKTGQDLHVKVSAESDIAGLVLIDAERQPLTHQRRGTTFTVFVKAPGYNITQAVTPIRFRVEGVEDPSVFAEYTSKFNAPAR